MQQSLPHSTSSISPEVLEALAKEGKRITPVRLGYAAIALIVLVASFWQSEINLVRLSQGGANIFTYIAGYFPPDFSDWRFYAQETIVTISMGIWGTLLSAVAAVPISLMASANLAPNWVVWPTRRILDAMRAIDSLVFALIFVVAVGLGPFAGVLSLFVYTAGVLGKLFSEANEAIDPGPVEGIRSTGANPLQEIIFGVLPQVMPLWASYMLYRFETNVRSASILGIVGAGGIGVSLYQSFGAFQYRKVCAIMIILVLTTVVLDLVSSRLRKRLI